ncbi:uncharacterized protein N7479_005538 [Penicillium vulpinum]|uniref:Uncharacterized protein n=1 Tax=Penicillium vulpinum TaxID=29845 RepID=A0A1V6SEV5_9EURO|nr:uncharacterized protein N7479_005538 [Penicillium vulpinum]KAJ5958388.1 hypothetical protein N7479_005538 [Penicillium vulpinum]OQE12299.1 hypothetical protein PENVUL_c001G07656 [Penicillium vulpinum]
MAGASLAFPAICLALSFLFVVAVYNASIMRYLGTFHCRVILPSYQHIKRRLLNRSPVNQNLPNHMLEPGYESINLDTKDEEDQHPPPFTAPRMSLPDYYRHRQSPASNAGNIFSDMEDATETDGLNMTTRYAGGPYRPRRWSTFVGVAERSIHSRSPSLSGSLVSSDEYDSDWSNSAVDEAVFEPRNPADGIPVWEFEVERPIYTLDQDEQGTPALWLDEVVEWTAQGVFAFVVPDMIQQRG